MRACSRVPRELVAGTTCTCTCGLECLRVVQQLARRGCECLNVAGGDDAARGEPPHRFRHPADVIGDRGHACAECAQQRAALVEPNGERYTLQAVAGKTLMRVAVDAGIDGIKADCGGVMSCATCHVYVDLAWIARLPVPSADEDAMLDMTAALRLPTSRLSCQIALDAGLDGLTVVLPETQY